MYLLQTEKYYIIIKRSIHQEDRATLRMHQKQGYEQVKQKLRQNYSCSWRLQNPSLEIDSTTRQKIRRI